uniref:Ig-like domain-containing protein n=1 Tax=Oryzias melastigma TaxID=30732 RepID=A0A3B3BRS5_ORYME
KALTTPPYQYLLFQYRYHNHTQSRIMLSCSYTNIKQDPVFKWVRRDLPRIGDVFIYRNHSVVLDNQHESFQNRVFLKDPQMKNGDLSVVLKNVTIEDTGTYLCLILNKDDPLKKHRTCSGMRAELRPLHHFC